MKKMSYSMKIPEDMEKKVAKAIGREMPISRKASIEVANAIRGMKLSEARDFLEAVIRKEKPVKYRRFLDSISHRKGVGPGRYPVKVARYFLKVLENLEANAKAKELEIDKLRIIHISTHKGRTIKKYIPRAFRRATPWFHETVNVQVIALEEES